MNSKDWRDICQFVDEHWIKGWPPEHQVTWYTDLKQFDTVDVWAAIHKLYEEGRDFPPNGSTLLSRSITERHTSAKADQYRGLPEPRGKPDPTGWIVKRFGEHLSGMEVVERIHASMRPCANQECGVHYPKVDA